MAYSAITFSTAGRSGLPGIYTGPSAESTVRPAGAVSLAGAS